MLFQPLAAPLFSLLGLPLAKLYVGNGYSVVGFDVDARKTDALKAGRSYIEHIQVDSLKQACDQGRFLPTTDFSRAGDVDAIIFCVPTPLNDHREPDISFITGSLESVLPYLKTGQVISLESTTYPGTTEEVILPRIAEREFVIGQDFFVVYPPEREDPNNVKFSTRSIPKICG